MRIPFITVPRYNVPATSSEATERREREQPLPPAYQPAKPRVLTRGRKTARQAQVEQIARQLCQRNPRSGTTAAMHEQAPRIAVETRPKLIEEATHELGKWITQGDIDDPTRSRRIAAANAILESLRQPGPNTLDLSRIEGMSGWDKLPFHSRFFIDRGINVVYAPSRYPAAAARLRPGSEHARLSSAARAEPWTEERKSLSNRADLLHRQLLPWISDQTCDPVENVARLKMVEALCEAILDSRISFERVRSMSSGAEHLLKLVPNSDISIPEVLRHALKAANILVKPFGSNIHAGTPKPASPLPPSGHVLRRVGTTGPSAGVPERTALKANSWDVEQYRRDLRKWRRGNGSSDPDYRHRGEAASMIRNTLARGGDVSSLDFSALKELRSVPPLPPGTKRITVPINGHLTEVVKQLNKTPLQVAEFGPTPSIKPAPLQAYERALEDWLNRALPAAEAGKRNAIKAQLVQSFSESTGSKPFDLSHLPPGLPMPPVPGHAKRLLIGQMQFNRAEVTKLERSEVEILFADAPRRLNVTQWQHLEKPDPQPNDGRIPAAPHASRPPSAPSAKPGASTGVSAHAAPDMSEDERKVMGRISLWNTDRALRLAKRLSINDIPLDLKGLGLTSVPARLLKKYDGKDVNLSNNRIASVELAKLPPGIRLDLTDNPLNDVRHDGASQEHVQSIEIIQRKTPQPAV